MRIRHAALASMILLSTATMAQGKRAKLVGPKEKSDGGPCDTSAWRLVFHDEFDAEQLDRSRWITWFPYSDDGSDKCEGCRLMGTSNTIFRDDLVSLKDGKLLLGVRSRAGEWYGKQKGNEGGLIHSIGDARFTYGRFEVRCRIPKGAGLWPAFWGFGGGTEIDMFEFCGEKPQWMKGSLHRWGDDHVGNTGKHKSSDLSRGMHLYAVEWDADEVRWYLDDRIVHRRGRFVDRRGKPLPACDRKPGEWNTAPYFPRSADGISIIVNLAVSEPGGFCNAPKKPMAWPASAVFEVDHVRVYQRRPHPSLPDPCVEPLRLVGPSASAVPGSTLQLRLEGAHGATEWTASSGLRIMEADEGTARVKVLDAAKEAQWVKAATDNPCSRTAAQLRASIAIAP